VLISVKDTGIGIEPQNRSIILKSFQKITSLSSGILNPKGVGLGLSISKKIIFQMQGSIWVDSTLGKGTSFYFKLPYNYKVLPSKKQLVESKNSKKLKNTAHTILIAEDDAVNFSLMESMLESLKLKLVWAKNGKG